MTSIVPVPKNLPAGEYTVRIAMTDPTGHTKIKLGIAGADADMRYPLGTIAITATDVP